MESTFAQATANSNQWD